MKTKRQVVVRYKTNPRHSADNERFIKNVFAALDRSKPEGLQYSSYKLADGVSFMHVASYEMEDGHNPLTSIPEFKEFTAGVKDRCDEPPVTVEMSVVGDYQPPTATSMSDRALFTEFWAKESKTTRKVLSRIPEGSTYTPDVKSRTAREIAWQIVCEENMLIDALETGKTEWAPLPTPATMKEIIAFYDTQSPELAERWKALPDARWNGMVEFFGQERDGAAMAWGFLLDIVHHRGQISTYLRPMGSTVPQIYGPSADEP
jgi:uncharacterized damage-inducible protein DinB